MIRPSGRIDLMVSIMTSLQQHQVTGLIPAPRESALKRFFAFPNPVNEYAARSTAAIVVVLSLLTLITSQGWGLVVIAIGFWLRLAFGPRISPAGILSVKVIAPKIGPAKLVPGPPKRFAQGIGVVISTAATIFFFTGLAGVAWLLTLVLIVAAGLESILGVCLGCLIFGRLQHWGVIPASVCEACNNVGKRRP